MHRIAVSLWLTTSACLAYNQSACELLCHASGAFVVCCRPSFPKVRASHEVPSSLFCYVVTVATDGGSICQTQPSVGTAARNHRQLGDGKTRFARENRPTPRSLASMGDVISSCSIAPHIYWTEKTEELKSELELSWDVFVTCLDAGQNLSRQVSELTDRTYELGNRTLFQHVRHAGLSLSGSSAVDQPSTLKIYAGYCLCSTRHLSSDVSPRQQQCGTWSAVLAGPHVFRYFRLVSPFFCGVGAFGHMHHVLYVIAAFSGAQ